MADSAISESLSSINETGVLPCETIVHRAILRQNCIDPDSGAITSAAFIRRPGVDTDGLSADQASFRSAATFAATFKRCRVVISLHTGHIRTLGLDVKVDEPPDENNPSHANLTGVPYRDDDPEEAERLASARARQSRIQWQE